MKPATPNLRTWRLLQAILLLLGVGIVAALLTRPTLGLHLLWDVLIPAAPLLFVLVPGFWRNVCPVSTVGMLAHRLGRSARREVPIRVRPWLALGGVFLLYTVVPLRHALFDLDATSSAFFLLGAGAVAFVLGSIFAWKSGWCAGLCPVRPVEALYGFRPVARFANAHCGSCGNCSMPCPDSTAEGGWREQADSLPLSLTRLAMVGGFPGFIWGWFHVADYSGGAGWSHLGLVYAWPLAAAAVTALAFLLLDASVPSASRSILRRWFAGAAVSCYYWYRLPALLGFGLIPGDGMLVDASAILPLWVPQLLPYLTTLFFAWWLVLRPMRGRSWMIRPAMASEAERIQA